MFKEGNGKVRILVIDDESEVRGLLINLLGGDYDCASACSAEDGLALLANREFDLILSDINMGTMSGLELVSKALLLSPDTVVVMISGLLSIEAAIEAMRAGAFDYLTKPFDVGHVEATVRRALEHRSLVLAKRHYETYLEELVMLRTGELERALKSLEEAYRSTLKALTTALNTRDRETSGHSERVVGFSLRLGRELGLEEGELTSLEYGALLHDIGKIGVADAILLKPARLSTEEWAQMRLHPLLGKQILRGIKFLEGAAQVVEQHHERWDGTGYPQGLSGEQIDLKARIFAVADSFDAIISKRVYKNGRTFVDAVAELERCAGTHFDPQVVAAFHRVRPEEWDELSKHSYREVKRADEERSAVSAAPIPPIRSEWARAISVQAA